MIRFIDNNLNGLRTLCAVPSIYTCRIMCLLDSYGIGYDFVQFWVQYTENNQSTSAIVKDSGNVTLYLTEQSDLVELTEFLQVIGFASVLCDRALPLQCSVESGIIMTKTEPTEQQSYRSKPTDDLKSVHRLLQTCQNDDFAVPGYEDFLLDISHKLRHQTAQCVALTVHDKPVATAMTVAQSKSSAIIGAVATHPQYRRQGLGADCVLHLCELLDDRTVFIMRSPTRNEAFYQKLGFENSGEFFLHTLQ